MGKLNRKISSFVVFFILILTFGNNAISQGKWTHITESNGIILGDIGTITTSPDGVVWIGGNGGLFHYSNGYWTQVRSDYTNGITIDHEGYIWIARDQKLYKYVDNTWIDYAAPSGILNYLTSTPDGSIWGVSSEDGLYRFDGESWILYSIENGLENNYVGRLTSSPQGEVWCAYGDPYWCECVEPPPCPPCPYSGVSLFNGETWNNYTINDGLPSNRVVWISVASSNTVYVCTFNGISRFNGETWETILPISYGNSPIIMAVDSHDVLWTFGYDLQLRSFSNNIWTTYDPAPYSIYDVQPRTAMAVDKNGIVWIGTINGILQYNPSVSAVNDLETQNQIFGIRSVNPNPFNSSVTISYSIPTTSPVDLSIYDILGRKIANLVNDNIPAGDYSITWDGRDSDGVKVGNGIYIYQFKYGKFRQNGKMILMK